MHKEQGSNLQQVDCWHAQILGFRLLAMCPLTNLGCGDLEVNSAADWLLVISGIAHMIECFFPANAIVRRLNQWGTSCGERITKNEGQTNTTGRVKVLTARQAKS